MYYPDIKRFEALCEQGNIVPVYREILADMDTPVSAFRKLEGRPAFLLESLEGGEKWARYSFLGIRPSMVIRGNGTTLTKTGPEGGETFTVADPIEYLRGIMAAYRPVDTATLGLPRFYGGLVGYMGYDIVRFIEKLPDDNPSTLAMDDIFLMLADTMLIFDNLRQTIKVVYNVHTEGKEPATAYEEATGRIDDVVGMLERPGGRRRPEGKAGSGEFVSSFGRAEDFQAAVLKAKQYILAGDIFQVVLSQRFQRRSEIDPFDIYRALRVINPSPYMYYIDTGDAEIVGSSPEILVRLEGGSVTLRPIAGTRKRGADDAEDAALIADLRADPKECAEHLMLVDLGRNDVGRVAEIGTVQVTDFMTAEKYSHVIHMVTNVEGMLREGLDAFDVLRASFPAGTVTGSPKIRAMEIIDELEPVRRGPYAGCVGYFGYSGNMDTCITIRTIFIKDGEVSVQAGAGIVADSEPAKEYQETLNKAMGMFKAVEMAERGLG